MSIKLSTALYNGLNRPLSVALTALCFVLATPVQAENSVTIQVNNPNALKITHICTDVRNNDYCQIFLPDGITDQSITSQVALPPSNTSVRIRSINDSKNAYNISIQKQALEAGKTYVVTLDDAGNITDVTNQ